MLAAFIGGSIGFFEILVVLAVLLLLFGARRLPSIARSIGKTLEEFRRAAHELSNDIIHGDIEPDERQNDSEPEKPSSENRKG